MKKGLKKHIKSQELIDKLQPFYKKYEEICDTKFDAIEQLNQEMERAMGIKGIRIYEFDTGWGIGTSDPKDMELIHDSELIERKIMQ